MIGQTLIPQRGVATFQATIQPRFQSAAGHRYSSLADLPLVSTMAQLQSILKDGLYGARKFRLAFSRYQDHFPTAPQQMRQAGLVQRLGKLTIDAPTIPHQKACEVCSQHRGCLFKSSPWLNRIDRHLGGAESPHPPQLSADSPTRLVWSHTRATANFFDQRLIGRFRFMGYPVQRLAQTAPTHLQSEGLLEHGGRFAVGQSQTFIQLRGQRQRSGAQLGGRTAHRIGGLPGMPPLHPPPAMSTAAHMNPKFNVLHPRFRNLGLELGHRLAFLELASASGTPRGQRHLDNLIDLIGNGPTIGAPVLLSWFASRFFGSGFGVLPREGGGLSLNRSQRLFQQSLQACVLFLQCFDLTFEPRNILCACLFCHIDTLAGRRMKTTTFSDIHEGKCLDAKQILPAELKKLERWVNWQFVERDGKSTKVPLDPNTWQPASCSDPQTWGTYADAVARFSCDTVDGIGFQLGSPYTGIDLDGCPRPKTGDIEPWAQKIIASLNSYTEVSPSGAGIHILAKGTLPPLGRRKGPVEIYSDGRYFTVTGSHLDGTPGTVEERQAELTELHAQVFGTAKSSRGTAAVAEPESSANSLSDVEIINRARNAKNGDKFGRLWSGGRTGYNSQSEADLALCMLLAFWTGRDADRIDSLFRLSKHGVEVAEFLTKHLSKKRIIIEGGSWGSILGIYMVHARPDLFYAYVGTAQIVNWLENLSASYDRVLQMARISGDQEAINALAAIGPPPWDSIKKWPVYRKLEQAYQAKLVTAALAPLKLSPEYASPGERAQYEAADDSSFMHFWGLTLAGPLTKVDLPALGTNFSIPIFIIQGQEDLTAVPELARCYFDSIKAPRKRFYLVPGTGHEDSAASLDVVLKVLLEQVRPLTLSRLRASHQSAGQLNPASAIRK